MPDASEHPELALPKLGPGSTFAGYRIERVIARGGMGVVYEAVEIDLDRKVALKIIAPEHTQDPTAVARFKGEARLAASIEHPNIVPIHRGGEEDGILYLAMRFVPGTNLRRGHRRRPHGPAARRADRQRRSPKPSTRRTGGVWCTETSSRPTSSSPSEPDHEHVYLGDFGLTKRLGSVSAGLTRVGGWVGTTDYVAPEQIRGEAADGRADVYSLGCVVYEMLTGEVAYPKDSDMAKLLAHVSDPPPLPRTRRPDLVEAFDEVVARATAKDPAARYATAGELAAALRDAIGEQEQHEGHTRVAARPIAVTREPSAAAGAAPDAEADAGGGRRGGCRETTRPPQEGRQSADERQDALRPARRRAGATHDRGDGPTHAGDGPPGARRAGAAARRHRAARPARLRGAGGGDPHRQLVEHSSSTQPQNADEAAGQKVTAELAPVPTNHVNGAGDAVLRLDGTEATVSIDASGLLDAPHAMHIHAGELGRCPPASAARAHGGHRSISTGDGEPFYGPPVTALTTTRRHQLARASSPSAASRRPGPSATHGASTSARPSRRRSATTTPSSSSTASTTTATASMTSPRWTAATCGARCRRRRRRRRCAVRSWRHRRSSPRRPRPATSRVATKVYTASLHVEADPPPWLCAARRSGR